MLANYSHDIFQYLNLCSQNFRQYAHEKALAHYENLALNRLPLIERHAELVRLSALHSQQVAAFDRQEYLTKGDQPQFLLKHFASGNRYFSLTEQEKYQQALFLIAIGKVYDHCLAVTAIRLEIQKEEIWIAEALSNGRKPDPSVVEHLNYLKLQLQKMQSHAPGKTPDEPQPKGTRGPAKKCCFGMQCSVELFRQILEDLNSEIHYLKSGTSVDDYIAVVTAPVPALTGIPLHMGCNNKQFMYVMYYFQSLFQSFDAATVANSGLFFSKEGNVYNSHNLNSTNLTHIEKRYAIDAIFRKYGVALPEKYKYLLKGI